MFGLTVADIVVILTYMVGISFVGIWVGRKVKNSEDYIMGGRNYGKIMMIMHSFAASTSTSAIVGVASKTFTVGVSGIWYLWLYLFSTPFFWIIAPIFRRLRALTTGDYFLMRYDKSVEMLYSILGVVMQVLIIGLTLKASGALISGCTQGAVSPTLAIWGITIVFLLYGFVGGLTSTMVTDTIQGILTLIFSFMLLPFVMSSVGGMAGIREKISSPEMLSIVAPNEIGLFFIIVLTFLTLVGNVTLPHIMGICATGTTEHEGRYGFTYGNFIKRVLSIPWTLTALAAVVYFAGRDIKPDDSYGLLAYEFLPGLMPGLMGLFLVTIIASIMAGCNNAMISASSLFVANIYQNYVSKNATQKHYVNAGRVTSIVIVGLGITIAFSLPDVVKGLELTFMVPAFLGIAFWIGFAWRRYTVAGAWASTLGAFFIWWLTVTPFFINFVESLSFSDSLNLIFHRVKNGVTTSEIYLPWVVILFVLGGALIGVIVSLLTKPVEEAKLEHFYGMLRTPVDKPEVLDKPGFLPKGMEFAPRKKLINLPNWELQIPSWYAIKGVIIAFFWVSTLVVALWAIVNYL